jgi:hypothetical protein
MPLQNRVDPFGNLIRIAARGTMMITFYKSSQALPTTK